jgi:hypothetical protein
LSAAAMERRKTPRKDWVLGRDETGRSVLEWKLDPMRAKRMEEDPCARTYDFLDRLNHPGLAIEEDAKNNADSRPAFNPYDHGSKSARGKKRS